MSDTNIAENEKVICENCGAEFDIHEPKCPFCGHINMVGAEEKYMQDMEEIKDRLDHIDEEQVETIKQEVKKSWKLVIIIMASILAIVLIFAIALYAYQRTMSAHFDSLGLYESDPLEVERWNDAHLADIEAMYEAGDIEGLVDFYGELSDSSNYGAFNNWEHAFLISQIYDLRFWMKYLDNGDKPDDLVLHQIMFNILYYYNGDYKGTLMPEEDYDIILDEVNKDTEKVCNIFNISQKDLEEMNEECVGDYGYIDPNLVTKYCNEHKDLFK